MPFKKRYLRIALPACLAVIMAVVFLNPLPVVGTLYSSEPISAVKLSPAYYKDSPVTIVGKVVAGSNHSGMPLYRVADKTGEIMVFYDSSIVGGPEPGSLVITQGTIQEITMMGSQQAVYIKEVKRLFTWGRQNQVNLRNDTI